MPTSPRNAGIPEPSTIRPFLISRSYAIATPSSVQVTTHRLLERECSTAKPAHPCEMRRIDARHRMILHVRDSAQPFELVDEAGDYRQTLRPEGRVGGVEAERREQ